MIHVCFSLHDKTGSYSKFTGTALLSLFENMNTPPQLTCIHLLHDNTLTKDNRDKFIQIANRYGQPLKFYNVEELCADRIAEIEKYFPAAKDSHFSIAMFYRFFIPQLLLPQGIEKAFYLDSDIIVNLDIAEFWQIDLGDKPFGAVSRNSQIKGNENPNTYEVIALVSEGIVNPDDYFFSGGLLMNLKVLREKEDTILAGIKFISEHSHYRFLDQDVLNYCFSTTYLKLPVNFNRVMSFERSENEWTIEKKIYHYAANRITLGMDMKDPYNRLWMDYFIKTPWVDDDTKAALNGGTPSRKNYAVSVVIPMYNAEEFIGECLNSLLAQTFQDFEVIVVDDCSTDNSCAVVENYKERFNGRLKLERTEKNSGGGGYVPRNIGVILASGDYIQFLDADDMLLPAALEALYMAAILYDTDVVYTSSYYRLNAPNDAYLHRDTKTKKWPAVQTELIIDDPNKNLDLLFLEGGEGNFHNCWTKFVRREFLAKNRILFPYLPNAGDFIWVINVYCHIRRFLRISVPLYLYRRYNDNSILRTVRTPQEQCSYWFSGFVEFVKALNELERANEILTENPRYCLTAIKKHFAWCLNRTDYARNELNGAELYKILHSEFSKDPSNSLASLFSFFFTVAGAERKLNDYNSGIIKKFKQHFTARLDIKLMAKGTDVFQIVSVSDDNAMVRKPTFLQKGGVGYQIQSYTGDIEIIVKATADGQFRLNLRGVDVRMPEDNTKRIPCWIDYTKLTVNDEIIFDEVTSAWHDKPYNYYLDVKAGTEIKIQAEWLPYSGEKSDDQENVLNLSERPITCAVSVVISLYNYEKYVGECLDSLLAQTFTDFEVIVVDDCSTDNSRAVVESYVPKFDGRLKITKTKTNSGGGGIPRNKGLELASGEYVFFMDADDAFTKTALEELYTLAKNYNADVVYCEKYYMSEGIGEDFIKNIHIANKRIQKPPFVDKPTLETNDLAKRTKDAIGLNYWMTPWLRLVQRKLLIENKILFDSLIASNDVGWTFRVLFCSKRLLRVPNICYIRRIHNESTSFRERTDAEFIHKCMDRSIRSLKTMDEFMSGIGFFKNNPKYRYDVIESFIKADFFVAIRRCPTLSPYEIYNIFRENFGDYLGKNDVLVSGLCAYAFNQNKMLAKKDDPLVYKLNSYITARLDVKFMSTKGNFQIVSVSDDKAEVKKPSWFQKGGVGYQIQSYAGSMLIVAKATVNGKIKLEIKGTDVRDPKDDSKRIPCWIDYSNLTINGKKIFNKVTPTWHDAPYTYTFDVKADEEIKIETEWLPHRSDVPTVATPKEEFPPKKIETPKVAPPPKKVVEPIVKKVVESVDKKLLPYFTARVDVNLVTAAGGDFQVVSVSDDNAVVRKANWLPKNEIGYVIQSHKGNMAIVAKATTEGKLTLSLRSMDVRNPKDNTRIPYWIDYTRLTVNAEKLFDEVTPVWHDKPYKFTLNVKAGDEIKIETEWQPHKSDT